MNKLKCFGKELIKIAVYFLILTLLTTLVIHEFSPRHTLFLLIDAILFNFGTKLFTQTRSYCLGLVISMSILCSVFIIRYLTPTAIKVWEVDTYISFAFAISNLILLVISWGRFLILKQILLVLILIIILPPILGSWGYYFSEHAWLNVDAIMAILQTNPAEAFSYIQDRTSPLMFVLLAVCACAIIPMGKAIKHIQLKTKNWKSYLAFCLFALLNIVLMFRTRDNFVTSIYMETKNYQANYEDYAKKKEERKQNLGHVNLEFSKEKGIYVLVIGESANRTRMSAYGYELDTTPWLKSAKNDPHLLLFKNAYSCHVQTVPALTYALTTKNQYNDIPIEKAVSILDMAEAAGYDTVWLSNQVKFGSWGTPVTIIADEANQQFWINSHAGNTLDTNYYDGEMLKYLDKVKISDKMLIIIHLMGSHISYHSRYPNEFDTFKADGKASEYDNSILYTDFFLQKLVEKFNTVPNFKGLVYFSDHAEGVNYGVGHDPGTFIFDMTYIPFFIYLSNDFIKEHPEKYATLKNRMDYTFTDDLIFNVMTGIMKIRDKDNLEVQNDLTSNQYDNTLERFTTLYGKKKISEDKN